ncbi:leucine-rich repeat and immunoglobulin-like domain containing protein [Euroglyphus maynei]|uniref:Leucine-rich repeat and immunoglobulin-like domain containing protein n=1 Tax=Euroglyphus maynei TaxID=6958 RepID=A0A1Y3B5J9_EURMA|nr:leucine-rich repeat and immunoglobulin-like domain containing protein [Euroglyphus maynei]
MIRLKKYDQIFMLVISLIIIIIIDNQCLSNRIDCPKRCNCYQTIVNCAKQEFHIIPTDLPTWTEALFLNDNPLETLVSSHQSSLLISPNNLTIIDLTHTQLRFIDSDVLNNVFNDVHYVEKSLRNINLNQNELTQFPLINHVNQLRSLSLSNNQLNYESIQRIDISSFYPHLEYIDLSNNLIKIIPKHFLSTSIMSNLTQLILNNNDIEIIEEDAFELFPNLKVLKISKNNIQIISKSWLGKLIHLRELDLNYNQINKIDILAFEALESLISLKMRRNKLNNLDDGSFWGLSNLQKLNLDHNNISEINEGWIYGLESLKELNIKHNSIVKIGDNVWKSLRSLIEINLSFNRLQHIRLKTFDKLNSLQILKLSNNNISYVDENSFRSLKSLQILDISYNQLSWTLEGSNGFFNGLGHLKELRLDNNQIRLIYKHTFSGLPNLSMLNLTANPLSSIQKDSFQWSNNLNRIHLEQIDLLCDCTMKWLHGWLQANHIRRENARKIRCKHPHDLAIRTINSFLDIKPEEFKCQDFLKPYLIEDFNNLTKPIAAIKNQEIRFNCKVATGSNDKIIFKWFKDSQLIEHDRAIMENIAQPYSDNVTHYTSILHLINIQDEDQGKYHCMASNSYGSVYSNKFTVNVYVAPYFIKRPDNVTVRVGHTAKLECAAKGQPNPIVSWQKDGGDNFPAAMERRMHVMPADDVFFIVEVKKTDMGSYSCHATNDAGTIVSTAYLNVIEMPSFVRKMVDKKSQLGSTVSLECMAAGIPMPQIVWYKDGEMLQPTDRHFFTAEGQLLIIVKSKLSDQGLYSCNISNTYGVASDSSYLEIVTISSGRNSNDFISSFVFGLSEHLMIVIAILICVIITSLAWIAVICFIRIQHNSNLMKTNVSNNLESGNHHHHHHRNVEYSNDLNSFKSIEYESDANFDSSSALDTGIGGSSHSNEDEISREYYSLPRRNYEFPTNHNQSMRYTNSLQRNNKHFVNNSHQQIHHHSPAVLSSKAERNRIKRINHEMLNKQRTTNFPTKDMTDYDDYHHRNIQMI